MKEKKKIKNKSKNKHSKKWIENLIIFLLSAFITFSIIMATETHRDKTTNAQLVNSQAVIEDKIEEKQNIIDELDRQIEELKNRQTELENKIEQVRISKLQKKQTVTSRSNSSSATSTERATTEKWIWANVSAYCSCKKCCGKTNGITASGAKAKANHTIAAPSTYKFGTKIEIAGMGTYVVEDRGGAIQGNKIDIYFDSHEEALKFGRRNLQIKVVQ